MNVRLATLFMIQTKKFAVCYTALFSIIHRISCSAFGASIVDRTAKINYPKKTGFNLYESQCAYMYNIQRENFKKSLSI